MAFAQLQVLSAYSLLTSPTRVADLIQAAADRGYDAIALTDVNVMYGTVDFYRLANSAGIKPILGLIVNMAPADEPSLVAGEAAQAPSGRLLLLAMDQTGYHNLIMLSSAVMTSTPQQCSWADLAAYHQGLAIIVPPFGSQVAYFGHSQNTAGAHAILARVQAAAGDTPVYLGVSRHQSSMEQSFLRQLSITTQLPLTAVDDVRYLDSDDAFSARVLQAVDRGEVLEHPETLATGHGRFSLAPRSEVEQAYQSAHLEGALAQSTDLAAQADVTLTFKRAELPHFPTPNGKSALAYLTELAQHGLRARFGKENIPKEYQDRLQYELSVIDQMGFPDYFLIVWDVMKHMHETNVMTGPGRGSAAGSLVSYALAITEVDPIQYHLLFERFLNPERQQMPDIDLDIPDNRREELIQYVHERYGDTHMAQIVTFGTLAAKAALRDVGRTFGLSMPELNAWTKTIPPVLHVSLTQAAKESLPLQNRINDNDRNRLLFNTAQRLEGLPRNTSTHAAGIVLSDHALTDVVAVQAGSNGVKLIQQPMGNAEALGLLKMDFLGLRNLSILAATINSVARETGQAFDPRKIPLTDEATLALFRAGDTNGVFQFESSGIKNVLRQLAPTSFEDIVATNALYRPGPMDNIPTFIARKHGQQPIEYPAKALTSILAPTYGVLVYQEQVMQVANVMGGFSLAKADSLRRAMSKKKKGVLDSLRADFLQGAQTQGYSIEDAQKVYDYIESFANYGFNRSHAVAYSMIAFWLAFLKVHYPAPFFAALLNSVRGNDAKIKTYVQEARQHGVKMVGPDINASGAYFSVYQNTIHFGLTLIKGIRTDFAHSILTERHDHGPFQSVDDFLRRQNPKFLKEDALTALILTGAFDRFDKNRRQLAANIAGRVKSAEFAGENTSLFSVLQPKEEEIPDYEPAKRADLAAEYLGAYISGHPTDRYVLLKGRFPIKNVSDMTSNMAVTLLLYVRKVKVIRTKKGDEMAFLTVEDASGSADVTVFPNLYRQVGQHLESDAVYLIQGKTQERNGEIQVVADTIKNAQTILAENIPATLYLQIPAQKDTPAVNQEIMHLLGQQQGQIPIVLYRPKTGEKRLFAAPHGFSGAKAQQQALIDLLGSTNVVLRASH
ncbi:DNA polymerase III subunit alpha [Schleiferilactobacillus perolens]|jgi:DNA polymerase-3 subunit alpha|uniref:DNA polymerase III subunit alpha n=1 Tax=Schleiferilactobacillus perolens TaxID=100468 RepID=UPI0023566E8D|nr:DNA polymerase III subunit alpha [Schleiferilactobacillus perolens]MCI2171232.1 DNA polymerase III subunit alpha [Schleiferilactobacillus perolens]